MRTDTLNAGMNALLFKNTTFANLGDATGLVGSSTAGSFYIGLHTADPGEAGNQTTSETSYTSYARVAVERSGSGWTTAAGSIVNAADITFPTATGGSATLTHWSIGSASSGTGILLYRGPLITSGASFLVGTATTADAITIPGHAFSVNDNLQFYPIGNLSLPTGITAGTNYFVKTVSGNDITISTTAGGATLDITAAGAAYVVKTTTIAVSTNIRPVITAGSLSLVND